MNFENIKTVSQPKELKINLYKHQLASIYNMENLEKKKAVDTYYGIKETLLGINTDITGYGKTLSMISLILRDKMEWDINEEYIYEDVNSECSGLITNRIIKYFTRLRTTLILVSPSIIKQWEKEFEYTNLKIDTVMTNKQVDNVNPEENDVILVTPSMYNKLIMSYSKYAWKRFIYDEPGHIRVPNMKMIYAGFYWLVTATPDSIARKHMYCRNTFMKSIISNINYTLESTYKEIIIKNDPEFIKLSYQMPETIHMFHKCYNPLVNAVKGYVSDNVYVMLEAGNIKGALQALGGKKTNNILNLVKNKKLEEKEEIESKIRIYSIRNDERNTRKWKIEKTKIDNTIKELDKRFNNMIEKECPICLDKIKNPVLETNCQNIFCCKCLLLWLKDNKKCPLCRDIVIPSTIAYLTHSDENEIDDGGHNNSKNKNKTKLQKVIDIIENKKDGQFIIFSLYDETFFPICDKLTENGISYIQIKGSASTRDKNIQKYKNSKTKVIFLNSNYNGVGINLQESTDIIIYHKMTDDNKNQVIGRALRIGRKEPLYVHHLEID